MISVPRLSFIWYAAMGLFGLVFWLLLAREWVSVEAAFPAMGAFTGGSYCLFMGVTGIRSWYETRHAPD